MERKQRTTCLNLILSIFVLAVIITGFVSVLFAFESKTLLAGVDTIEHLDFTLLSGGESYSVKAKSDNKPTGVIEIPAKYDDKPVVEIPANGFENCSGLISVAVPSSITKIGELAFSGCSNLEQLTLPFVGLRQGLTSVSGDRYFYRIFGTSIGNIPSKLKDIIITGGRIYEGAFQNLTTLESITIKDNVTKIGTSAFNGCTGLKTIVIKDNLTEIGNSAFSGCTGLENITIPNTLTTIQNNAFNNCKAIKTVNYSRNGMGWAFENGVLTLANKKIYDSPAWFKANINPLILEVVWEENGTNVKEIGNYAFNSCYNIESIVIPSSVERLGNNCFASCVKIQSIVIPSGLKDMGSSVFVSCDNLSPSVSSNGLSYLASEDNPYFYLWQTDSDLTTIEIDENCRIIGSNAFWYNENLTSVTIPQNIFILGDYCFAFCENIESVTLNDGLKIINYGVFIDCPKLTKVFVPNTVTKLYSGFVDWDDPDEERNFALESIVVDPSVLTTTYYLPGFATWYYGDQEVYSINRNFDTKGYVEFKTEPYDLPTLNYYDQDGTVLKSFNSTVMQDYVPTKQGYTFNGWYLDEELTQTAPTEGIVLIGDQHNFYASFAQVPVEPDPEPQVENTKLALSEELTFAIIISVGSVVYFTFLILIIRLILKKKLQKKQKILKNIDFFDEK